MAYQDSWNKIVAMYNKNLNCKEEIVQASWELLFSTIFNYADSNIVSQLPVKMGVETKRADILIKDNSRDLFVVELKRHTLHNGQAQLFSYLNQLKIDIGVLVCDKLYIYNFDYTTREENYSFVEIDFLQDNPDGAKFVELFSCDGFDKQKVKDFISAKNQSKNNTTLIRQELTNDSVLQLVKNHLTKKYPIEDVENVLAEFQIEVHQKSAVVVQTVNSYVPHEKAVNPFYALSGTKDNTQYMVNGTPTGGKGSTVFAAISFYVKSHSTISFAELQKAFPDYMAKPGFGKMVRRWEEVSPNEWSGSRFKKQPIILSDGQRVAVSTQWNPNNMRSFILSSQKLGIEIKPIQ
ncbi:MAG: type I restriction enzyme HsdR N-terminal domain-containing protein [Treponema sp.]|nr:type I restriction enzyme HsdR N-terminal domain-containing protein [Treponema sp.]